VTSVKLVHLRELRAAVGDAYIAARRPAPGLDRARSARRTWWSCGPRWWRWS